jgi:hypothetical protein
MHNSRFTLSALILVCFVATLFRGGPVAYASPISPSDNAALLTETLIEAEGGILLGLGEDLGPDPGNILSFTSAIDFTADTFSFSADPGTEYLGQALIYSASGSMDPTTGDTSYTGSGTLGTSAISETGSGVWTGDPDYPFTDDITIGGVTYSRVGMTHVDTGNRTSSVTLKNKTTGKTYSGTDTYNSNGGKINYTWGIASDPIPAQGGIKVDATGVIDLDTGLGIFDAVIGPPTPEPATIWMVLSGALVLGFAPLMSRPRRPELS